MTILTALLTVVLVASLWCMYCNNKTYDQRDAMLDAMRVYISSENYTTTHFNELMRAYRKVSYNQHAFALIRFRDPMKLYDPELLEIVNE